MAIVIRVVVCLALFYGQFLAASVLPAGLAVGISAVLLLALLIAWAAGSGPRTACSSSIWRRGFADWIGAYLAVAVLGAVPAVMLLILRHFEPPTPSSWGETVLVTLIVFLIIAPIWYLVSGRRTGEGIPAGGGPAGGRAEGHEAGGQGPDPDIGAGPDHDADHDWD